MFDRNSNQTNLPPQAQGSPYGVVTPNTLGQDVRAATGVREGFLTTSFVWMFMALLVSAASAWFVITNEAAVEKVTGAVFGLLLVEIVLVLAISRLINRIGALPALALLFAYALINGLVLGLIVLKYTGISGVSGVVSSFAGASAIFAGAAIYGGVTKRDLTSLGGILFVGLIGLIVTMVVQVFLFPGSSALSMVIGLIGVVIFTALTAVHVQRLKEGRLPWIKDRESASVVGALWLYLDFVNLFLFMLRIFSGGRN